MQSVRVQWLSDTEAVFAVSGMNIHKLKPFEVQLDANGQIKIKGDPKGNLSHYLMGRWSKPLAEIIRMRRLIDSLLVENNNIKVQFSRCLNSSGTRAYYERRLSQILDCELVDGTDTEPEIIQEPASILLDLDRIPTRGNQGLLNALKRQQARASAPRTSLSL